MKRLTRTTIYGAIAAAALVVGGTAAFAADMPTKAPPPAAAPAPPPSNWVGFIEVGANFGQVNPQGQAVYKEGDYNVVAGAVLNLYKSKDGFINNWSVGGLGIVDFTDGAAGPNDAVWAGFGNFAPMGGSGLYYILQANTAVTFAQVWTLTEEFFHLAGINASGESATTVVSPLGNNCANPHALLGGPLPALPLGCLSLPAWYWNELKLSLNDGAITKWPISFNPYVTWWHEFFPSGFAGINGTSTSAICFSCNNEPNDFIIGIVPKMNMAPYWGGIPLTLTAPTWVTVGSKNVWQGTNTNVPGNGQGSGCIPLAGNGSTPGAATNNCSTGNVGVFSSGLTGSLALTSIPAQYGHWSAKAGFQWFDIVNKSLQYDNLVTYGFSYGLHQDIWTGFVGLGVAF